MKKLTEGRKMFLSVMMIFLVYAIIFIVFEDYDRNLLHPLDERNDWHLLFFSIITMGILAFILHRYSQRMDERISREQAEKENMIRRQLTQNISHELKTPVASILGYAETILNNPDISEKTKNQFIERTHTQAQRLTSLLRDISILNRMDYGPEIIEKEKVDISQLVSDIMMEVMPNLEKKQMTFINHLHEKVVINANPSLLYSIFRNLFDNAINYAGENTTVELTSTPIDDYWQFTFSDNGIGVKEEHLPHLFERFYRVDKGRSRTTGGTGLGLAIVKNAVQLHGGNISVRNGEESGLTFIFTLKKK